MTVRRVINRFQVINAEISGMIRCPQLEDYPQSLDTGIIPIALTEIESGQFEGFAEKQSTDEYVVRVLFEAIGQSDLGSKLNALADLYDAYRTKYVDPDTYSPLQEMALLDEPYRAVIGFPIRTSGIRMIEYPVGLERWWHGFEIRFTVTEDWEWICDD